MRVRRMRRVREEVYRKRKRMGGQGVVVVARHSMVEVVPREWEEDPFVSPLPAVIG